MGTTTQPRRRGNLRWALLLTAVVLALWFVGLPVLDALGRDERENRPLHALVVVTLLLTPVTLVWVVGEAHLRWSPSGRVARGVVGWALAFACLGLLVWLAPVGLYLLVMSLALAFG